MGVHLYNKMKRKQRVKKLCKESDPRTIRLGLLGYSLSLSLSVLKLDEREVLEMKKSQTFECISVGLPIFVSLLSLSLGLLFHPHTSILSHVAVVD